MLKFVFKIIIFAFPLLILVGITEYKANSIPSNYAIKRIRFEQNIENTQVIITGASHAYYGIKPELLGVPGTSIAYVGQDIYYDTRILLKYLPRAANAKLVIISISYPSLEYRMQDSVWGGHISFYRKFWGVNHETSAFKIADYSAIALFGVQQSREFLLTGKVSEQDEIDERGGNANMRYINKFAVMNGRNEIRRQEFELKTKYLTENVKYLEELLNSLKLRGIQAVIVTTPCYSSYYNNINVERYTRMQQEIQEICRKYDLTYENFFKDSRFTEEDFYDSNHLSSKGTEKFSLILRDEVLKKYIN